MPHRLEPIAIVAAILYLFVLGLAMVYLSYDVWGGLVVAPLVVVVTLPVIRSLFSGEYSDLFAVAVLGLMAKLGGSVVRYWVVFSSYAGWGDSNDYSLHGSQLAEAVRSGRASPGELIPRHVGTDFIDHLTGIFYTVFGSSRLGGFFLFAWLGYWGAVLFVRAALVAVPGLAAKRYAALVFLMPSMLYWPSSIGKEAWLLFCLGLASYGIALILSGQWTWWSTFITVLGTAGGALARPHFSAVWLAALVFALIIGLITGGVGGGLKTRFASGALTLICILGLSFVASLTLSFLNPETQDSIGAPISNRIDEIFQDATSRTATGRSTFTTVTITGPQDWPEAVARTMTRPLLNEARSLAELMPAIEMTFLLVCAAFSWQRIANVPRLLSKSSYVLFALVVLFLFGLAFSRIGNLGILTRQRSLVMPLFFVTFCVPRLSDAHSQRPPAMTNRPFAGQSHP